MNGKFITFEGGEGCGKTTQIALLAAVLRDRGLQVFTTREPGGDPVAEAIRAVLLNVKHPVMPDAELMLFLAARSQVVQTVLLPHLRNGETVLCDRFTDSTLAYQGYARNKDVEAVRALNEYATCGLTPDLTLLLDISPEIGLARQTDKNRMEYEPIEFHRLVRDGYLTEAQKAPDRVKIVDASRTVEEIHYDVLNIVNLSPDYIQQR